MDTEDKKDMLNFWIEKIVDFLRESGVEVDPMPEVVLDETPNREDELFIKTGYYDPGSNQLVMFIDNRHIKDILRTFCHEMVHRHQNAVDPDGFMNSASNLPLEQDRKLEELEGEAYLMGNLLFRRFTERYTHNN